MGKNDNRAQLLDQGGPCASGPARKAVQSHDQGGQGGPGASGAQPDILSSVQAQCQEVKSVMQRNVDQMLTNMSHASQVEASTADLAMNARAFQRSAGTVRRQVWLGNLKMKLATGLAILLLLLGILWWAGAFSHGSASQAHALERRLSLLFH